MTKTKEFVEKLNDITENIPYVIEERFLMLKQFYDFVTSEIRTLEGCYKNTDGLGIDRKYVLFFLKRWKINFI
jgi:hypothetical protein